MEGMNDNLVLNPGDSISNKGSNPDQEYIDEIKEIEKEKSKDMEKKPIPQSIIFTILGLIACISSFIETSLMSHIFFSYKNKNIDKSKLFLEDIKYIALFFIALIIINFKFIKPSIYHIVLSFLFSFISYSSSYLYSRNAQTFILLSKVFCIIFVSIFIGINNILKLRKSHTYELPTLAILGVFLAASGILIEFVSSYFFTITNGDDYIRILYHYNDIGNFSISLLNGICYASIICIFDLYCKTLEIIFNSLFYVGAFSSIICFILSLCYNELTKIKSTFSGLGTIQVSYYILSVALFLFYIFLLTILIKKCSLYSAGIIISAQMSIRIFSNVGFIMRHSINTNICTILSLLLCIAGLSIICWCNISNYYGDKKNETGMDDNSENNTKEKLFVVDPMEQNVS